MAKSLEDGDFKGDLGGEMGDNLPYYAIIETPKIWKITPSTSDSLRDERPKMRKCRNFQTNCNCKPFLFVG